MRTGRFSLIAFLMGALLLLAEPMAGKVVLPRFGGAPATWSALVTFFQITLVMGTLSAYALGRSRHAHRASTTTLGLLGLGVLSLLANWLIMGSPWSTPDWGSSLSAGPEWRVFASLASMIGPPILALAASAPLIQSSFTFANPNRSPYRLYAFSNLGALAGLVAFPLVIEPAAPMRVVEMGWALAFVGSVALWGSSWPGFQHRRLPTTPQRPRPGQRSSLPNWSPSELNWKRVVLALSLAFLPCILMLVTTQILSERLASVPLVWVLPLGLYLSSMALAFSGSRWAQPQVWVPGGLVGTALVMWYLLIDKGSAGMVIGTAAFSVMLLGACTLCHTNLAILRPPPRQSTLFYLIVSVGGALGGVSSTWLFPSIFPDYWELPLALCVIWFVTIVITLTLARPARRAPNRSSPILTDTLSASGLGISVVMLVLAVSSSTKGSVWTGRDFFGLVQVKQTTASAQTPASFTLIHGGTVHGMQFAAGDLRRLPTTYYSKTSGIGLAFTNRPAIHNTGLQVGVIGLGVGTLAAYSMPDDTFTFFEIDPQVIRLAAGEGGYFDFISNSSANIRIVEADGRIGLEQHPERFDLLVIDAFTGGAVPSHLLTLEAGQIYLDHLRPAGVLAFNITNRLDLARVVSGLAQAHCLPMTVVDDLGEGPGASPSRWALLSANEEWMRSISTATAGLTEPPEDRPLVWTDDSSSLVSLISNFGSKPAPNNCLAN